MQYQIENPEMFKEPKKETIRLENMNLDVIKKQIENTEISWNCIFREGQHEIGCPHKDWAKEELLNALISKKKFEQSGLAGTILTK